RRRRGAGSTGRRARTSPPSSTASTRAVSTTRRCATRWSSVPGGRPRRTRRSPAISPTSTRHTPPSATPWAPSATGASPACSTGWSSIWARRTGGGGGRCTAAGAAPKHSSPGERSDAVIDHLETDADGAIEGVDEFRQWLQTLLDTTIAELDGVHFDIPDPVKRVEAMIAPPGGAAAMYYTGPA